MHTLCMYSMCTGTTRLRVCMCECTCVQHTTRTDSRSVHLLKVLERFTSNAVSIVCTQLHLHQTSTRERYACSMCVCACVRVCHSVCVCVCVSAGVRVDIHVCAYEIHAVICLLFSVNIRTLRAFKCEHICVKICFHFCMYVNWCIYLCVCI